MNVFLFYSFQIGLILFFLTEEVNYFTYVLFVLVILQKKYFKIKFFEKIFGFFSFVFSYILAGHQINPEMGLNLLFCVVTLKLLESKELRDYRMLTLGLFILWGAGSLFDKTIGYFLFAFLFTLLNVFYLLRLVEQKEAIGLRSFSLWILKALPFACLFFLFQPRFHSSLWSPPQKINQGEIGFSEEARPGDVSEINPSQKLAFHAQLSPDTPRELLYWRGVTLSTNDGWSWQKSDIDHSYPSMTPLGSVISPEWIKQEIIHKKAPERAFALDHPVRWIFGDKESEASETGSLSFYQLKSFKRYKAFSSNVGSLPPLKQHLKLLTQGNPLNIKGLPMKVESLHEARKILAEYFSKNNFQYSLSPGKIESLAQFLEVTKGWCTHYASATGLILRSWGHPTRLVSGYLGGEKIEGEPYYTISENDAHVWLEVWDNNTWARIDPTLWVMPERMQLTGFDLFVREKKKFDLKKYYPDWLIEVSQLVDKTNFTFMLWLEDFDREKQREIAQKMDLNLNEFYMLVVWVLLVFIGIFFFIEWKKNKKTDSELRLKIWKKFLKEHDIVYRHHLTISEVCSLLPLEKDKLKKWEKQLYQSETLIDWHEFKK